MKHIVGIHLANDRHSNYMKIVSYWTSNLHRSLIESVISVLPVSTVPVMSVMAPKALGGSVMPIFLERSTLEGFALERPALE